MRATLLIGCALLALAAAASSTGAAFEARPQLRLRGTVDSEWTGDPSNILGSSTVAAGWLAFNKATPPADGSSVALYDPDTLELQHELPLGNENVPETALFGAALAVSAFCPPPCVNRR